jgi:hypothetical protein
MSKPVFAPFSSPQAWLGQAINGISPWWLPSGLRRARQAYFPALCRVTSTDRQSTSDEPTELRLAQPEKLECRLHTEVDALKMTCFFLQTKTPFNS